MNARRHDPQRALTRLLIFRICAEKRRSAVFVRVVPGGAFLSVTSYAFDAPWATFYLSYDTVGQQYVLLAKTAKTWAGQTHTLTVTLDDNSVHTQEVKF